MGSIFSKLFGGGGGGGSSSSSQHQHQPSTTTTTPSSSSPTQELLVGGKSSTLRSQSKGIKVPHTPSPPTPTPPPPSVLPFSPPSPQPPLNIIEVEVDEEAFKQNEPIVYTSTISAQINQSPPHPLQQQAPIASHEKYDDDDDDDDDIYKDESINSNISSGEQNPQIEEAVIKIQAGVRGFLVRKQIKENNSSPVENGCSPQLMPIKQSMSLNETNTDQQQQQQQPDTILPPPESFWSPGLGTASKPITIGNVTVGGSGTKRVETPIPGSPFAQDMPDDVLLSGESLSVEKILSKSSEHTAAKLLNEQDELEIFKKINEINQLLASSDEQQQQQQQQHAVHAESPITTTLVKPNFDACAISASNTSLNAINSALNELDQTIQEQERTLSPECSGTDVFDSNDSFVLEQSAFEQHLSNVVESVVGDGSCGTANPIATNPVTEQQQCQSSPVTNMSNNSTAIQILKSPSIEDEEKHKSMVAAATVAAGQGLLLLDSAAAAAAESQSVEEAAAIRIQAAFRGYEVRKSLSREVSPARQPIITATKQQQPDQPASTIVQEYTGVETLVMASQSQSIPEYLPTQSKSNIEKLIEFDTNTTPATIEPPQLVPNELSDVAIKDGFGTVTSNIVASEQTPKDNNTVVNNNSTVIDIEKSIQELEKSFDRDLLADNTTTIATTATTEETTAEFPLVITTSCQDNSSSSMINIEPSTPDVQQQQQPTPFPSVVSSKIPTLDRTKSPTGGILKEPSSPEPNTHLTLPTCVSPIMSDTTTTTTSSNKDGDSEEDEDVAPTPSPIPLRASSPNPCNKKRHRNKHRGNRKR